MQTAVKIIKNKVLFFILLFYHYSLNFGNDAFKFVRLCGGQKPLFREFINRAHEIGKRPVCLLFFIILARKCFGELIYLFQELHFALFGQAEHFDKTPQNAEQFAGSKSLTR